MKFLFLLLFFLGFSFQIGHCLNLPEFWIAYFVWLKELYSENPCLCLPQVIKPTITHMLNLQRTTQDDDTDEVIQSRYRPMSTQSCCLPPVLVWNPLCQYPKQRLCCPLCQSRFVEKKWNVGQDKASQPRLIHDTHNVIVLVGVQYSCLNSHKLLSYDPRILCQLHGSCIPFVLTHRSGFTKEFLE